MGRGPSGVESVNHYTWRIADGPEESLVVVRFEPRGDATEVVIVHEQIPSVPVRDSHEQGWNGCLDGLERYVAKV